MSDYRERTPTRDLPLVHLRPFRVAPDSPWVDPVDPEAARLISASASRTAGVLPYAQTPTSVYVAAVYPLHPGAEDVLASLGRRTRLSRCGEDDLAAAQDRIYGATGQRPARLGEILLTWGKAQAHAITDALARQSAEGGRLGALLTSANEVSFLDLAEAMARQFDLPLVDLLQGEGGHEAVAARIDVSLFDLMPETFWRSHLIVPIGRRGQRLTVAMFDPSDRGAVEELEATSGMQTRLSVTGYRDVVAALESRYRSEYAERSREDLVRRRPLDSARQLLSVPQWIVLIVLTIVIGIGIWLWTWPTLITLNAIVGFLYLWLWIYKMRLLSRPAGNLLEIEITPEDLAALPSAGLPIYTVLVPAYREAAVLPLLTKALMELDYPKDRLDVKLLLEEDDAETLRVARESRLPNYIEIIVLPESQPKTKPKACNYGLFHARGEYLVIYDAEDIPEPDQLKKAIASFRKADPDVACIQAKLSYFNWDQNLLTRWFTAEYAMWFDLLLPALHAAHLPIPLGGTSNHFKVSALLEVGAWDPYNVAEDADLGIRLHKAGYRVMVLDSTTYEEANSEFVNWVRQRSRWVKGYLQTWLVHMRNPFRLWRELGAGGFLGFQLMVGGTPFPFLLNPIYWALTTLWFLTLWGAVPRLFPTWIYYIASVNLFVGNFGFIYTNMVGSARRGDWDLVKYEVISPLYWAMMSVAAWKALLQLVTRPSFWEKTQHGLTDVTSMLAPEGQPARLEAAATSPPAEVLQ